MERHAANREPVIFDSQDLLARCLGKLEFMERVLAKFDARFDLDLQELEQALRADDLEAIARVAHRLKGASANVAAERLRAKAAHLEEQARGGRRSEVSQSVDGLRSEWRQFSEFTRSDACAS